MDELEATVYDEKFKTRINFFKNAAKFLKTNGCILFAYSDYAENQAPIAEFLEGYDFTLLKNKLSTHNELNKIYFIKPSARNKLS